MFTNNPTLGVRLLLLLCLSFVLMALDHQQDHLRTIRSLLSLVVIPVQHTVALPGYFYDEFSDQFSSRESLISENSALKERQLLLEVQIQQLKALEHENKRLQALVASSAQFGDKMLVAKLLQVDSDPFSHRLVLDKGKLDGVFIGQPVLDAQGVVGQVVELGPLTSTVLLISDVSHALPVQSDRSGTRAIAVGNSNFQLIDLNHVTTSADIQVGDLIITSGLGGRFPAGYPVGKVESIDLNPGDEFAAVKVLVSARLDKSREFVLLWPQK